MRAWISQRTHPHCFLNWHPPQMKVVSEHGAPGACGDERSLCDDGRRRKKTRRGDVRENDMPRSDEKAPAMSRCEIIIISEIKQ